MRKLSRFVALSIMPFLLSIQKGEVPTYQSRSLILETRAHINTTNRDTFSLYEGNEITANTEKNVADLVELFQKNNMLKKDSNFDMYHVVPREELFITFQGKQYSVDMKILCVGPNVDSFFHVFLNLKNGGKIFYTISVDKNGRVSTFNNTVQGEYYEDGKNGLNTISQEGAQKFADNIMKLLKDAFYRN